MKCPKCQFETPGEMDFCGKCSHKLRKGENPLLNPDRHPHSYTPKFLADKILSSRSAIEGERKQVTVLFADVSWFTSMSEKLDPEDVHKIMDGCFKILMDEIHYHQGTINQFTGDGVMALFGAPLALEDHAQNACHVALSIQNALKIYSRDIEKRFGQKFQMRIGINSGPVVVGSIGDDLRMDYTAIGDTTNLAARMENLAKPGAILVSPNTYKRINQSFKFKHLGKVIVKGKEEPLDAYVLVDKIEKPGAGLERKIYSEMVGRDKDLDILELQIMKAVTGEGSVVNIIGEAGIGKSRLMAELKNRRMMKKVTLIKGKAISMGRNLSFHPIISLLKHWARIKENDAEVAALEKLETAIRSVCREEADEILPFIATLMGMTLSGRYAKRVEGIEGESLQKLILKSMKDLLTQATELTPLVIVTEDLHWADTSSIELLESLFRLSETRRIVFVNVFRPDHPETGDRIIETLKETPSVYCVGISLSPLDQQNSETLINNMLNIQGLRYKVKNKIIERSGGNPFFIEEVVRSFIDEGAVVKKNGTFEVTDKINTMVIPQTINDVLMARIDRLEEETRNLVKVASVIGRNFFYRILSEVVSTIEDMDNRLSYLKEIQLIRDRMRIKELEYLFKHALAQEAVYESILLRKRKELHLKIAESIEKVFIEKIHEFYGTLALHYTKAEKAEKAEEYLIKAGEEALKSSASAEALIYFQDALTLYEKIGTDPDKMAMLEKNIGIALFNRGRTTESVEYLTKVLSYYNQKEVQKSLFGILNFCTLLLYFFTTLYIPFLRWRKVAGEKESEILSLLMKKNKGLVLIDTKKFFIESINQSKFMITYDASEIDAGASYFIGYSSTFFISGVSYRLSRKMLDISKQKIRTSDIRSKLFYEVCNLFLAYLTGEIERFKDYDENLTKQNIRIAEYWNVTTYLGSNALVNIEQGDFSKAENFINWIAEIAETYEYDFAKVIQFTSWTKFLLKYRKLNEGLIETKKGIDFIGSTGFISVLLTIYSINSRIFLITRDTGNAKKALSKAKRIASESNIPPMYRIDYLIAQYAFDIHRLEELLINNNKSALDKAKKQAHLSGKMAVKNSKKVAFERIEAYKLMGIYYWLITKQKKALKWWSKSIKEGERLGARPELSRTYFEIGKRLIEPSSKYKALNGIKAEEYLEKAKMMFEEMDLQWDLDELEKVKSELAVPSK